jgi:hypothetical protein
LTVGVKANAPAPAAQRRVVRQHKHRGHEVNMKVLVKSAWGAETLLATVALGIPIHV